jgi:hypothetical protein
MGPILYAVSTEKPNQASEKQEYGKDILANGIHDPEFAHGYKGMAHSTSRA